MVLLKYFWIIHLLFLTCHALRKGKFPSPPTPSEYCLVRNVSCISLPENHGHCLSTRLTYQHTALIFAHDSRNLSDVFDHLKQWAALKAAPDCWNVIQPFLCSVYLPKCDEGVVERSSFELCQRTRKPCAVVADYAGWPEFLQCEALHFQSGCYPVAARQNFNRSAACLRPLIPTENPSSFYAGIKGCGVQCQNPMFTKQEHDQVHRFVAIAGSLCLLCTLFAILTFLIDWKSASKYPSLILFFINLCFFLACIGWLLQFSGLRESIVCRRDGTVRVDEPKMSEGESPWCTVIFFIVYFFMMSGIMWFVALAFSWYLNFHSFGARNSRKDEIEGKTTYFHIFAWGLPLVLTIVTIAIAGVEGDSLSGICFVGYFNHGLRAGLVLAPLGTALIPGLYFLIKGVLTLRQIRLDCPDFVSHRATSKIKFTIIRVGLFTFLLFLLVFVSLIVHVYLFTHEFQWRQSFKNFVVCLARNESRKCVLESRPNLSAIQLNIFTFFGTGIVMSSWVWTKATFRAWNRFLRSLLSLPVKDSFKMKNRKIVAQVFAQRRDDHDRQSVATTQDDPIGMNVDFNSAVSRPESSALRTGPRVGRRRRVPNGAPRSAPQYNYNRRYSDSDIQSLASYMSRRISGESVRMPESSHRNSFYSRHHAQDGLDIRAWARNAAKRTRTTRIEPVAAPITAFHKQQFKLRKRHEAALERAARNSEVSSISDGVSELSSAVFDRNLPLPDIGQTHLTSRPTPRKPDYTIFTASAFSPGELKKIGDPLNPDLPGSVNSEHPTHFKRPMTTEAVDFDDDSIEDISVLEM